MPTSDARPAPAPKPFVGRMALPTIVDRKYRVERFLGLTGPRALYEVRAVVDEGRLMLHLLERDEPSSVRTPLFGEEDKLAVELCVAGAMRSMHIVPVIDRGMLVGGERYVVTEWSGEETLAGLLRERCRLPAREVSPIVLDVLAGLADLHVAGITHGALSPQRVALSTSPPRVLAMLTDRGQFPLGIEEPDASAAGYTAPEVAAGGPVTPMSDVYSVGAILFRAVTGWHPGARNVMPPGSEPPLDPEFAKILGRAMSREVGGRYPGVEALREALAGWLGGLERVDSLLASFLEEPVAACSPSRRVS